MQRVKDKVIIVTGGASGMGRTHCELLAEHGAWVFVCDVNETAGEETANAIRGAGGKADFVRLDVTNETQWTQVVDHVLDKAGRLDVLVNNAGILLLKSAHETTTEEWDRVFDINVRGVFFGTRAAVPALKVNGGSIVNVSSIYGLVGAPMGGAYQASKGAVRLLSKSCAADLAPFNIRVNSVHPGVILTEMTKDLLADPDMLKAFLGPTLLARPGLPREVSQAVLFLASDESSFVVGTEIVVDGGYTTT